MPKQNEITFSDRDDLPMLLFAVLDALGAIARRMHPSGLGGLVATLTDRDEALRSAVKAMDAAAGVDAAAWTAHQASWEQLRLASSLALQACDALRAAVNSANPMREAYRALRRVPPSAGGAGGVGGERCRRWGGICWSQAFAMTRSASDGWQPRPNPDTGVFHFGNQTDERGGFSVYVPPWYEPARPTPWSWRCMAAPGTAGCSCGTGFRKRGHVG